MPAYHHCIIMLTNCFNVYIVNVLGAIVNIRFTIIYAYELRMIFPSIMTILKRLMNNGILEGLNSLVQAAKARARGYCTTEYLITVIYKLRFNLPTVDSEEPIKSKICIISLDQNQRYRNCHLNSLSSSIYLELENFINFLKVVSPFVNLLLLSQLPIKLTNSL